MEEEQKYSPEEYEQYPPEQYPPEMLQQLSPQMGMTDPLVSPENLKYLLNPEELIDKVKQILRGKEWDIEKKKFVKKYEPLVNELGLHWIEFNLLPLYKEIMLSKFDEETINNKIKEFAHVLASNIWFRNEEWGIKDLECRPIYDMILNFVHAAYARSENALEKAFLRSTQMGVFSLPHQQPYYGGGGGGYRKKSGFFRKFNPFKRS